MKWRDRFVIVRQKKKETFMHDFTTVSVVSSVALSLRLLYIDNIGTIINIVKKYLVEFYSRKHLKIFKMLEL